MGFQRDRQELRAVLATLWKRLGLTVSLGILVGSACAVFLAALDWVTAFREARPAVILGLPLAGMAVGLMYSRFGRGIEGGNNLIIEEIHEPGGGIPWRMAPLILLGTLVTHLFGGSAGREGTAVQMGGGIAGGLARLSPGLSRDDLRILLMAGVSAGFGGVFGTPVAGTIFAMEVLIVGRMNSAALMPCLIAGIVSDQTCLAWGIGHTHYHVAGLLPADSTLHAAPLNGLLMVKVVSAAAAFGAVSYLFAELTHGLQALFRRGIPWAILRPAVAGILILLLTAACGTRDYLGLGVTSPDPEGVSIVSGFRRDGAEPWSWAAKLGFTSITLAGGFKGGEVTPLFFIGATLGNTLAGWLQGPTDLFAALGFIAVFAGATNTPIACTMMGIELFGGEFAAYFAVACGVAHLCSGHSGIYLSQRLAAADGSDLDTAAPKTLRDVRQGGIRDEG